MHISGPDKTNLMTAVWWALFVFIMMVIRIPPLIAESPGRVPERLSSDWQAPAEEDYHDIITELDADVFQSSSDDQEEVTIDSVQTLLNQKKISKATRAGLMVRLAQLYNERSRKKRSDELNQYRQKLTEWQDSEFLFPSERPDHDFSGSLSDIRQSIAVYRNLLMNFPRLSNDTQIMYQLATMQLISGNPNALIYFSKIIKKESKNPWGKRAALGAAAFFMFRNDLAQSRKLLTFASQSDRPELIQYARYLYAWTWIREAVQPDKPMNPALLSKAIPILKKLAIMSDQEGSLSESPEGLSRIIAGHAIRDLSWIWSESYNLKDAGTFFQNVLRNEDAWFNTAERIGWKFEKAGDVKKASSMYHILFRKAPAREHRIRIQMRLTELFHKKAQPDLLIREVADMAKAMSDKNSPWLKRHLKDNVLHNKVRSKVHDFLISRADLYHENYRNKKNSSDLQVASVLYGIYLFLFPKGQHVLNARFNYALTLDALNNAREAVKHYHIVAKDNNSSRAQKSHSAERMTELQLNIIRSMKEETLPPAGTITQPVSIPEQKKIMIPVVDTYIRLYPSSEKSTLLRYTAAKILFDYGHYEEAIYRYQETIRNGPASEEARRSIRTVLDFFENGKKWETLRDWCEKFVRYELHIGRDMMAFVIQKLKTSMWNIALNLQTMKKYSQAASAFLRYQKRLPADQRADLAISNAMQLYFTSGDGQKGISTGMYLLRQYPASALGADTYFAVSQAYQSLNQHHQAAVSFESFATKYPQDPRSPEALYQAAQIYKALKNPDRSALLLEQISKQYPSSKQSPQAILEAAEIHISFGQNDNAARNFSYYLSQYPGINPEKFLYAQVQWIILSHPEARNHQQPLSGLDAPQKALSKKPRTFAIEARDALGRFYFDRIQHLTSDFFNSKVAYYDFNEYGSSINDYMSQLQNLEVQFKKLIAVTSHAGTTEAWYKLGTVYERALNAFSEQWNLDGLNQEEARNILNARERLSLRLKSGMEQSFQNAYKLAVQNQVFTPFRNDALRKLAEYKPEEYNTLKENIAGPKAGGP